VDPKATWRLALLLVAHGTPPVARVPSPKRTHQPLRVGEDDPVERWDIHAFGQTLGIADQQGLRQIRIAEVGAMLLLLRVCPILVGQQPFEIETRDADLVMVALRTSFPHTKNRFVRRHR
jgi:hypothetical protein